MMVTPDIEEKWAKELHESRVCFKTEMQRVLNCFDNAEKKALLQDWKLRYSPERVDALIKCAQDKKNRIKVANWNIDHFGQGSLKDNLK
jgi:hypothetical protein